MSNRYYHFKGTSEDIINSILSLLIGKEHYEEVSYYSNFVNESQPMRYRKKLNAILDLMQRENLILLRENPDEIEWMTIHPPESTDKNNNTAPSENARVYIRQHGKQVLSDGGYKRVSRKSDSAIAPSPSDGIKSFYSKLS